MVSPVDVPRAAALQQESAELMRAMANLQSGQGRIIAMTIDPDVVTIPTDYISYPQPMADAILAALWGRQEVINKELEELGVTMGEGGGESEGGEALLRASLQREPNNIGARLNLAADFLQDERAVDALKLLDEVAPPFGDPRPERHWYLQKSLALLQLGRAAQARSRLAGELSHRWRPALLSAEWRELCGAARAPGRRYHA